MHSVGMGMGGQVAAGVGRVPVAKGGTLLGHTGSGDRGHLAYL